MPLPPQIGRFGQTNLILLLKVFSEDDTTLYYIYLKEAIRETSWAMFTFTFSWLFAQPSGPGDIQFPVVFPGFLILLDVRRPLSNQLLP